MSSSSEGLVLVKFNGNKAIRQASPIILQQDERSSSEITYSYSA